MTVEPVLDQNSVPELFRLLKLHKLFHQSGIYIDFSKGSHLMAVAREIVDQRIDTESQEHLRFRKLLQDDADRPKGDLAPAVLIEKENGASGTRRPFPAVCIRT